MLFELDWLISHPRFNQKNLCSRSRITDFGSFSAEDHKHRLGSYMSALEFHEN